MLRQLLEARTGPLTDSEFRELAEMTTTDVRANHLDMVPQQKTSIDYILQVAGTTYLIMAKENDGCA